MNAKATELLELARSILSANYGDADGPVTVTIQGVAGHGLTLFTPGGLPAASNPIATAGGVPTKHSPDFRWAMWFGKQHIFTPKQAAIVRLLWEAWEQGIKGVSADYLLENSGDDTESRRIDTIFAGHAAWRTMIVSAGRGIYRLSDMKTEENEAPAKKRQATQVKTMKSAPCCEPSEPAPCSDCAPRPNILDWQSPVSEATA